MSLKKTDFDIWADAIENFKSDKQERIQALIDKYGWPLDGNNMEFKDSIEYDFIKPYLGETNGSYRIAENALSSTQSDGRHYATGDTSDERLLREAAERLKGPKFENLIQHIYLDTEGKITTGVGALIDDEDVFMAVDWLVDGKRPATVAEKKAAYDHFQDLKRQEKFGQKYGAGYYKDESRLQVPEEYALKRLNEHLQNDLKKLREGIDGFDNLPYPLKDVLMDIRYNTGSVTRKNWKFLREGIDKKDLTQIFNHVNRPQVSSSRNKWTKERVKAIPAENGWHW